jgi:hypothetical protein
MNEEQKRAEAKRLADVAEAQGLADVAEKKRLADVAEAQGLADVAEKRRLADVAEAQRIADNTTGAKMKRSLRKMGKSLKGE